MKYNHTENISRTPSIVSSPMIMMLKSTFKIRREWDNTKEMGFAFGLGELVRKRSIVTKKTLYSPNKINNTRNFIEKQQAPSS